MKKNLWSLALIAVILISSCSDDSVNLNSEDRYANFEIVVVEEYTKYNPKANTELHNLITDSCDEINKNLSLRQIHKGEMELMFNTFCDELANDIESLEYVNLNEDTLVMELIELGVAGSRAIVIRLN